MEPDINPFASPQTVDERSAAAPVRDRRTFGPPYASGHARAVWTMGLLGLTILLCCAAVVSTYLQVGLLSDVQRGVPFNPADAMSNDARQQLVGLARLVIGIATATAFLMWFHRTHRNLPSLGAMGLEFSPRWAVGGFFVPFLNLVRPYQVMSEVWRGSDPSPRSVAERYVQRAPVASIIGWWWGMYLFMGVVAQVSVQMARATPPGNVEAAITVSWILLASELIAIPAAVVTIVMIQRIDANQTARYEYVRTQPAAEPDERSPGAIPSWLM